MALAIQSNEIGIKGKRLFATAFSRPSSVFFKSFPTGKPSPQRRVNTRKNIVSQFCDRTRVGLKEKEKKIKSIAQLQALVTMTKCWRMVAEWTWLKLS